MPYHTPQSVIENSRVALSSLDPNRTLSGLELFIGHNKSSLQPLGSDITSGVSLELPEGLKVADLMEAFRIGEANFIAILVTLRKMEVTLSRPDQRIALEEALDHLSDFSKIIIGIHCAGSPDNMNLSDERIVELMEVSADAIRYAQHEIRDCKGGDTDHLEFLQARLQAHEKLNSEFALRYLKSIGKEYCVVKP